jgi:hypothetical protein
MRQESYDYFTSCTGTLFIIAENDRLPYRIRDGVRYIAEKRHKTQIQEGIKMKRTASDKESNVSKKPKAAYMVCAKKFDARASENEMGQELTEDDLGTDTTHRILQCKIR